MADESKGGQSVPSEKAQVQQADQQQNEAYSGITPEEKLDEGLREHVENSNVKDTQRRSSSAADYEEADTNLPGVVLRQPVHVDNKTRRSDEDGLAGHFVDVVDGEHEGRRGVFDRVVEHDKKDGYPTKIIVRTRDERDENLVVNYKDVRPCKYYSGGR